MTRQVATTVYLDEEQWKRLSNLAHRRKTSFSGEIRSAIERYLGEGPDPVAEKATEFLVKQANSSIDRMVKALDEAHYAVQAVLGNAKKRRRQR